MELKFEDYHLVRQWMAWIARALSTRAQLVCWHLGDGGSGCDSRTPLVVGGPATWRSCQFLEDAIAAYRSSRPPDAVAAGTAHTPGQALRGALGRATAILRVGTRACPYGVLILGNRGCAYTAEELALAAVAAGRIGDAIAQEATHQRLAASDEPRLRAVYERDALIDFSRGLAQVADPDSVSRHLLLLAMGLTTATGGYVGLVEPSGELRIGTVRGHVLVARGETVRECLETGRAVFCGSNVLVPILSGGRAIGYLALGSRLLGDAFKADDVRPVEAAAFQAGMALEVARLRSGGRAV